MHVNEYRPLAAALPLELTVPPTKTAVVETCNALRTAAVQESTRLATHDEEASWGGRVLHSCPCTTLQFRTQTPNDTDGDQDVRSKPLRIGVCRNSAFHIIDNFYYSTGSCFISSLLIRLLF